MNCDAFIAILSGNKSEEKKNKNTDVVTSTLNNINLQFQLHNHATMST